MVLGVCIYCTIIIDIHSTTLPHITSQCQMPFQLQMVLTKSPDGVSFNFFPGHTVLYLGLKYYLLDWILDPSSSSDLFHSLMYNDTSNGEPTENKEADKH